MKTINKTIFAILFLVLTLNLISAVVVDADYITLYPGEEDSISLNVENNENFDIEEVSISLDLSEVPFTSIGSSVKDIDDLDEDDDDSVSFTLRPSTDITPGDYLISYQIKYTNAANNSENFSKSGNFGIRVSARTDIDFSVEPREIAIVGEEGQVSFEIVNMGLGEIKSVSVQIFPQGFTLLSSDKVFVGTVDADDSDTATFDVIYKNQNPVFSAKVTYKDFDNNEKTEIINLPLRVYTQEEALELGLIIKSKIMFYISVIIVLLVLWYVWRRIKKRRKMKEGR